MSDIGTPNDDCDCKDARERDATWSVGGGGRLTNRLGVLFSAAGNTAILDAFGSPVEVGAGVGVRLGGATVTVIPTVGLSDASPRYAVNVAIGAEIFRR